MHRQSCAGLEECTGETRTTELICKRALTDGGRTSALGSFAATTVSPRYVICFVFPGFPRIFQLCRGFLLGVPFFGDHSWPLVLVFLQYKLLLV